MSRFLAVVVLAALAVLPLRAAAQDAATPEAVVAEIYKFYQDGSAIGVWPSDPAVLPLFSERMAELLAEDEERLQRDGMGRIDFDPFVGSHDFALDDLRIARSGGGGERATVDVTFRNFGEPARLVYDVVREEGAWRIDDIASPDGSYPWRLRDILENGN